MNKNSDMIACAAEALCGFEAIWNLSVSDLIAVENGHHFHRGWHIGWMWGSDEVDGCHLDFLSEHRMAGISVARVAPNGSRTWIAAPKEMRRLGATPEEDDRLESEYLEHNRRAYADLRRRGLLPPFGANIGSQVINEVLQTGAGEAPPPQSTS
ncbi:hypothetical protein [Gulosibacter massiliensis]|uniref:hypothetical protein n=1 Tax=Gulosibacter massiliensis TaxID=2479839 RepID=UPI000F640DE5|nr:hypothetical protein [Gulosibacter massiliensis]